MIIKFVNHVFKLLSVTTNRGCRIEVSSSIGISTTTTFNAYIGRLCQLKSLNEQSLKYLNTLHVEDV
jgi:hypothetical protein